MNEYEYDEDATKRFREALEKGAWDDWLFKDTDLRGNLLALNAEFQSLVKQVRNEYKIETEKYKKLIDWNTWPQSFMVDKSFPFDAQVTDILVKANLMAGWRKTINTYILTDIMAPPPAILIHDSPDRGGIPKLVLEINDVPSKSDFDRLFGHVHAWVGVYDYRSRQKKKPYPHMPYYFEIYELHSGGMSNNAIAKTLREKYEGKEDAPTFTTKFVREKLIWLKQLIDSQLH